MADFKMVTQHFAGKKDENNVDQIHYEEGKSLTVTYE
jgi:hypothetical protein